MPAGRRAVALLLALSVCAACKEDGTVRVRSLEFRGMQAIDAAALRAVLATRVSSPLPWGRRSPFVRARFDADQRRIEAFYADRGFPDARVTGVDVKVNQAQTAVDLTVSVDEGRPVTLAEIRFAGFDVLQPDRLESLQGRVPLTTGAPRDRQKVLQAHELAVNELREQGFPYARVATAEDDGPDGKRATITFSATPGPRAHFGEVEIVGNKSVSQQAIRRQLTFRPGDMYRRSVVQTSQRQLYGMELFQFVNIELLDTDRQAPELRTRVTVAEGRHQRLNFGVGYGSDEKGRVEGEYHHVNFLGGGRTAGAHARWSSLDRGVRLDFNQPYFFDPHLSLGADAQQWRTFTPAYESQVLGGKATMTRRLTTRASWAVSLTSERNTSDISEAALDDATLVTSLIALGLDPNTKRQDGTLNAVGFDYERSTADNPLNARRGYQMTFHAEQAGRWLPGTFNYVALSSDVRHYLPIRARVVVANRIQVGNITAAADTPGNVPFARKFFLGGATSLRGWGRYEVSPLSDSGRPLGGNTILAFSSEVRAPITGSLGGVVFVDGGNVWPEARAVRLSDLRYATGLGLRYQTPVGPIRFDVGYQVNPIPGLLIDSGLQQRRWRIHFSIGQAF